MQEFDLINNYFFKIAKKNKSALNLNDDVFFDKKKGVVISVDTYNICLLYTSPSPRDRG